MDEAITTTTLLQKIESGWQELQTFLAGLSPEQMTLKHDAAGWTVKDHVIHMARWENGMTALLDGTSRLEAMGIGDVSWDIGTDSLNALIQQRNQGMSLEDVLETTRRIHAAVTARIARLSDDELKLPYKHFQPNANRSEPVLGWLIGNTFEHYEEHIPWMKTIAETQTIGAYNH